MTTMIGWWDSFVCVNIIRRAHFSWWVHNFLHICVNIISIASSIDDRWHDAVVQFFRSQCHTHSSIASSWYYSNVFRFASLFTFLECLIRLQNNCVWFEFLNTFTNDIRIFHSIHRSKTTTASKLSISTCTKAWIHRRRRMFSSPIFSQFFLIVINLEGGFCYSS